jgi:uncharacterized OB-fold protein
VIPVVSYLQLKDQPRLVGQVCERCGMVFFDRRNGCAQCGATEFSSRQLATTGTLRSFTVVHRSAPGLPTPYVSAVVALDGGGLVKARLDGIEPDPDRLTAGLRLGLTTFVAATGDDGTDAVAFAFTPIAEEQP